MVFEHYQSIAVTGVEELSTLTTDIPDLAPDEALVAVAYTGICGSDIPRYFSGGVHAYPQVLGHEFSGVVVELPENPTKLPAGIDVGSRVTVAPLVPDHSCDRCRAGAYAQCSGYSFIGSRQPGAMAELVVAPQVNLVPVPDGLSLRAAALTEPLTVALHGIEQGPSPEGKHVAILGGGVIGLLSVLAVLDQGAREVTVVDIADWNLDMARRLGAKNTVNSKDSDPLAVLDEIGAPDLVIETAGAVATRLQSLQITAPGGAVVFIGTPSSEITLSVKDFERILRKELELFGSWMSYSAPFPGRAWHDAVRLLEGLRERSESAEGVLSPEDLISHEFALDSVAEGFQAMRGADRRLKVMFRVGGEEAGS